VVVFRWREPGTTTWSAFPRDTDYLGSAGSAGMINYRVESLDRMLSQLRAGGVTVDDRVEDTEFGRFGWAVDPEGNRFELREPLRGQ
jgi:predicted enzyme related to lactoylglutathione lyase